MTRPNAWGPPMGMKINLGDWIQLNVAQLKGITDTPLVEVSAIAAHNLQQSREWVFAHPEFILSKSQVDLLNDAVDRLRSGTPLPYITGKAHFFGLEFRVTPEVLIPRPETEQLVELAIQWLEKHPGKSQVADIGTGSGAIAIALADRFPQVHVVAADISPAALEIARENGRLNKVSEQVEFVQSYLLRSINTKFDLLLANLPYIPSQDLLSLRVARFEPKLALDGGEDGLQLIGNLLVQSVLTLAPGGCMILEFQYNHTNAVRDLTHKVYPDAQVTYYQDLAGIPRGVIIQS